MELVLQVQKSKKVGTENNQILIFSFHVFCNCSDLTDHSLCPPISNEDTTASGADSVLHSETEIEVKPPESCSVQGLQVRYILLLCALFTFSKVETIFYNSFHSNKVDFVNVMRETHVYIWDYFDRELCF